MADGDITPTPDPGKMALSHKFPRCGVVVRDRILAALASGCDCGSATATMRRRKVGAGAAVYAQCDGCGRAVVGPLPLREVYFWQDLQEWDAALREKYDETQRDSWIQDAPERASAWQTRREEYANWLKESPSWAILRQKVLRRAEDICEACLSASSSEVHHETYDLGKLPPAWELHAVCPECHRRLHGGWRRDLLGLPD